MDIIGGEKKIPFDLENYDNGIARRKIKNEFEYYYIRNDKPVSKKDMDRIKNLKIPPGWENVWISGDIKSPIQAVGIDAKDKKQYRYHQEHIERAEKEKFILLYDFIKSLPKLQNAVKLDLRKGPYNKDRVIASMIKILKETFMRVGKEIYAREHKSYGISSLKKKHLKIDGNTLIFNFKGKSNQRLNYTLTDPILKAHLSLLMKLDGDKLFQYIDEYDKIRKITDKDLNEYLQSKMGDDFTIKMFRTYGANYYFVKSLLRETRSRLPKNDKQIKKNILNAFKSTILKLKHTKSVSKKSYVINFVINMYQNNPKYFIDRKEDDPNEVLLDLLKQYKQHIINTSF